MFEGAYDMSLFITFEGGEGSGKTTIAKMLHKQFIEEGYNITFSREPGGVDIAEQIRTTYLFILLYQLQENYLDLISK